MRFEGRTLLFDIIMLFIFIIMGLFWFDVIVPTMVVKVLCFAGVIFATSYFGVYRNHNYTEVAFRNQGRADVERGKVLSNLDVAEQTVPDNYKGVEN